MKAESLFREICRPCPSRLTSKVISSRGNPTSWIVPDAAAKAKSQFFLARSAKPWVLFRNSSLSVLTTTILKSSSSFWRKKAIKSMSCHWESKDILQCFHFQHSRTTPSVSKLFINKTDTCIKTLTLNNCTISALSTPQQWWSKNTAEKFFRKINF